MPSLRATRLVVVQDLQIRTDNVKFLKAKYYSASEKDLSGAIAGGLYG